MSFKSAINAKKYKLVILTSLFCAAGVFASLISAQNIPSQATSKPSSVAKPAKAAVEIWDKLTPAQQSALLPLYANWANLSDGQKRKWIAVSANFAQFSPQDKARLHSRMTDWANLSAKQRTQARINFAQSKTLTAKDKQTKWETYKALPPETKQALANIDVAPKPTGAATSSKPAAKGKLVTRTPKADKTTPQ